MGTRPLQWFNPLLQQGLITASGFAKGTFNVLAVTLLVLILSLYIIIDIPKVGSYIDSLAPVRSIQQDLQALWRRFSEIWKAYLRGQILISLLLFAVYTVLLPLLRVNNAFGLALAAGALEFLPVIGPVASSVLIILVALFQDTTAFGLTTVQYGLLVALCVVAVQQVESNIIVPRIIGNSLRLHPVAVLLSVLMGTSLAGVLGAVLAAPVMASAKTGRNLRLVPGLGPAGDVPGGGHGGGDQTQTAMAGLAGSAAHATGHPPGCRGRGAGGARTRHAGRGGNVERRAGAEWAPVFCAPCAGRGVGRTQARRPVALGSGRLAPGGGLAVVRPPVVRDARGLRTAGRPPTFPADQGVRHGPRGHAACGRDRTRHASPSS